MADNYQKTPLARSLESFGNRKVMGQLSRRGQCLPGKVVAVDGSIVTINFLVTSPYTIPNVTMPIAGPQWSRAPTQVGDTGICIPASVYIGGVSGLGGGTADLSQRAPLAALTFFPVGNANWSATDDPNSWVLYGPDGVILRTSSKSVTFTLSGSGVVIKGSGAALALVTAAFQTFFNAHVHADGGAGPPTIPMPDSNLTTILTAE